MRISDPSIRFGLIVAVAVALPTAGGPVQRVGAQAPAASQLGTITFPTSAKPAAQAPFLTGTKALYNFEFDLAGEAFRESQKADLAFALAYWGEAMSYNHPLWAAQDLAAARRVLGRLAGTAAERAAKAPAGKERELVEAVDILFGAGDKLARDKAYAAAMQRMHATYPNDDEIACFYALALLGTARPGESNTRNAMQAAAISQEIFRRNPQHPGAAHYIIHAFDDPDHAILGLPAARAYSRIAPSAAHALHMPSHIFVQLGLWDDVVASNVVAYKAANDLADLKNLPRGREDFHTLSWLQYAYLQQGKFDEADKAVTTATAERLLKDATAIELTLDAPSGPAEPIQPSFELYGDLLIELHRPAEAAAQFQQALQRMPNRRASLRGLERASGQRPTTAGQPAGASQ